MLQTYPNILGEDDSEYFTQVTDESMFYYLDPTHRQMINVYFMESVLNLKDKIWDIFEFYEKEI